MPEGTPPPADLESLAGELDVLTANAGGPETVPPEVAASATGTLDASAVTVEELPDWLRPPAAEAPVAGASPVTGRIERPVAPAELDLGDTEEVIEAERARRRAELAARPEVTADVVNEEAERRRAEAARPVVEPLTTEAVQSRDRLRIGERLRGLGDRARQLRDRVEAAGDRGFALAERVAQAALRVTAKDQGALGDFLGDWAKQRLAEAPAETPEAEATADEAARLQAVEDTRVAEERQQTRLAEQEERVRELQWQRERDAEVARQIAEQGIADDAVEAYKRQITAEAESARLAEEAARVEEQRVETERMAAEQTQRDAEEAARVEEMRKQAEARRQWYEALKGKALGDNEVELLVRGVVGRDADGNRSAPGMIEDAGQVISNELAAAQQKELSAREGITQAQELMQQRETELQQQREVRLGELRQNAEERLQLPGMREELTRVTTSLQGVTGELDRLLSLPARLQKTYAAEIARLRAEKAGFTAKKNGLSRTVTQLEGKAAKFVEAQTPEVETWYQTQLLQAGREVQTFVDQQEGYDRADVEAWARMELDTTIHEAGVALDNLERWQNLMADPEGIAKQIAEVQAQQDLLVADIETRMTGLNGDVSRLTENLAEAKEIQKRAKSDRAKERAKIEVKRAEVALADAQAGLDKANKELKTAKKTRKAAVDAERAKVLPAELLEEEGVNYGGEVAVTALGGETNIVSLVDVVNGNRGRRKEVPRTEAVTPVGKLSEFVVWGGDAMEPDENGNLIPTKVKGVFEREGMRFAARLEEQVRLTRNRLETEREGGTEAEPGDINERLRRAIEQSGEGAQQAAQLAFEAARDGQLDQISPENQRRLGEMVHVIADHLVDRGIALAGRMKAEGRTSDLLAQMRSLADAMEMVRNNKPDTVGELKPLQQSIEMMRVFAGT